jgi:hypothetical protein
MQSVLVYLLLKAHRKEELAVELSSAMYGSTERSIASKDGSTA